MALQQLVEAVVAGAEGVARAEPVGDGDEERLDVAVLAGAAAYSPGLVTTASSGTRRPSSAGTHRSSCVQAEHGAERERQGARVDGAAFSAAPSASRAGRTVAA